MCIKLRLEKVKMYEEKMLNVASTGVLEDLKSMLFAGNDINESDFRGVTPLMIAVKNDYKEMVKFLCNNNADVNKPTTNGETALYIACDNVNRDVVELLIDAGSDVNAITNNLHPQTGRSPLMVALPSAYEINVNRKKKSEAIKIVKLLLSCGCHIDTRDWAGNTALHLAADRQDVHTVCLLAEYGADLHIRNKFGFTAFEEAIQPNKQRYSIASILLLYGYDIETVKSETHPLISIIKGMNHPDAKYFTASHITRRRLFVLLLKAIHVTEVLEKELCHTIENFPNISLYEKEIIGNFIRNERPRRLQELCRFVIRKAIGKCLMNGIRSLPVAKSMKYFLALDFDIDKNDPQKILELLNAIEESDKEQVEIAVTSDIDLNFSFSEQTPLTEAAKIGDSSMCDLLLDNGADVNFHDNAGMTAFHWAALKGHQSVAEMLIKRGADVNKTDLISGQNNVNKVASSGNFEAMRNNEF